MKVKLHALGHFSSERVYSAKHEMPASVVDLSAPSVRSSKVCAMPLLISPAEMNVGVGVVVWMAVGCFFARFTLVGVPSGVRDLMRGQAIAPGMGRAFLILLAIRKTTMRSLSDAATVLVASAWSVRTTSWYSGSEITFVGILPGSLRLAARSLTHSRVNR